jgi:AraC-like DNA-binding protein
VQYRELPLPAPLDRWVECLWTVEAPASSAAAFDTIVPDGCPELILQLGDRYESADGEQVAVQPAAFLMGALSGPLRVRPLGRTRTVGLRFRPGGLASFLRVPLHELTDRAVPIADVFGAAGAELAERAANARGGDDLVHAAGRFLRARLAPRQGGRTLAGALVRSRGRSSVDALATHAGVSARHLERVFRDQVGLSPKRLARVVRLQEVLRRVAAAPERWVDVALDCGYADQAHLSRDFRALTGESPARFSSGALARQFTTPARLDAFFSG